MKSRTNATSSFEQGDLLSYPSRQPISELIITTITDPPMPSPVRSNVARNTRNGRGQFEFRSWCGFTSRELRPLLVCSAVSPAGLIEQYVRQ